MSEIWMHQSHFYYPDRRSDSRLIPKTDILAAFELTLENLLLVVCKGILCLMSNFNFLLHGTSGSKGTGLLSY